MTGGRRIFVSFFLLLVLKIVRQIAVLVTVSVNSVIFVVRKVNLLQIKGSKIYACSSPAYGAMVE
jgi:hypothetical protein